MSRTWPIRFVALPLVLGGLIVPAIGLNAGDKKKDDQKKAEKKAPAWFEKNEALTDKDDKDTRLKESPRKVYAVPLKSGKIYRIDLASKDFDAVLRLEDAAGNEVAYNDDFQPGSLDARILFRPSATATFEIIVTSLDRKLGKFTVTEPAGLTSASIFKNKPIALKAKAGQARHNGELIEKDGLVFDHYYQLFTMPMEAGKTYRIDHKSKDFDAYLFLEDPHGNKLAEDDDSGAGTDSRIVHKAAETGAYRIIATTLPARQTGKFTLEVAPADPKGEKQARVPPLRRDLAPAAAAARRTFRPVE